MKGTVMDSIADTSTSIDTKLAALDAAQRGYRVFPVNYPIFTDGGVTCSCENPKCDSIGKHPMLAGWQDSATTDEEQIREWWEEVPEANIGTPTGLLTGLVVVDEDSIEGSQWTSERGYETGPAVKTGRGTQRHFDPVGREIKGTSGKLASGVDTRGEGGFVLLPGSVHRSGARYEWEIEGELPPAPEWMPEKGPKLADTSFDTEGALQGFDAGERNSGIASLAGSLRNSNVPKDAAAELVKTSARNSRPPLDEGEALAVLESIYNRYPAGTSEVSPLSPSLNKEGQEGHYGFVRVADLQPTNRPREFVIEGVLPKRYPTIIFGDGGVAKSLNLVHQLQCIARGEEWLGRQVMQMNVAYLDFELDQEEQTDRCYEVAVGMGYEKPPDNFYYKSTAGLDTRTAFQQALNFCTQNDIGVLGIDSVGMAVLGNSESAADVLSFFRAFVDPFRAKGITLLMIDHQSKLQAGERYQNKTIFGSAYKSHSVRSAVQVEVREREEDALNLTFRQTKTNFGPKQDPFGVKVTFGYQKVQFEQDELSADVLAQEGSLNAADRILNALEDGPMYPADIAEATTLALKTVKNRLRTLREKGKVEYTGNQHGQAMEVSLVSSPIKGQGQQGHLEPYPLYGPKPEQEIEEVI